MLICHRSRALSKEMHSAAIETVVANPTAVWDGTLPVSELGDSCEGLTLDQRRILGSHRVVFGMVCRALEHGIEQRDKAEGGSHSRRWTSRDLFGLH